MRNRIQTEYIPAVKDRTDIGHAAMNSIVNGEKKAGEYRHSGLTRDTRATVEQVSGGRGGGEGREGKGGKVGEWKREKLWKKGKILFNEIVADFSRETYWRWNLFYPMLETLNVAPL